MDELIEIVKGKFGFLKKYSNWNFDKPSLREVSSLLRFLFIDNWWSIQQIKNKLNLEDIKIELNKNIFDNTPWTIFYQHWWWNMNGDIIIQWLHIVNRALTPVEIKNMYEEQKKLMEQKEELTIWQYFNTISLNYNWTNITKEFLVKFSANKLWWNHYDESRNHKKEQEEEMMLALDKIMKNYEVLNENPIFIEIMSIGQLLSNDKNLNNFIDNL